MSMSQALRSGSYALRQHVHKHLASRTKYFTRTMALASQSSQYHILNYKYVPDILEKRGPHRDAHLGAARKQDEAGKLLIAGAVGDPVDGGVFVFKNTSKEDIEEFVQTDPYMKAGLISSWSLQPLNAVAGSEVSKK